MSNFLTRIFRSDSAPAATRRDTASSSSSFLLPGGVQQGWSNPYSGLGVPGLDPTAQLQYCGGTIPSPPMVDRLWTFDWLAARIIEMLPTVALVRGFEIDLGGDGTPDATDATPELLAAFNALNYTERFKRGVLFEAVCGGNAHGGSVMLLGYKNGSPLSPLDPDQQAGGITFLDLFLQHELRVIKRYSDPASPLFGMPEIYEVVANLSSGYPHPRTGQMFHASRAIRFGGNALRVPNTAIPVNDVTGSSSQPEIGISCLTPILSVLGQYGLAWAAVSNMMQDASVGWMKIAGLVDALAEKDHEIITDRLSALQQTKGIHKMLFLDADNNEEYGRTEVSLTDVPQILVQYYTAVAAAANCPARILFSTPPQGLNASSGNESDLKQLYNNANHFRQTDIGPKLEMILTGLNGGSRVKVSWPSLWESSEGESATTRTAHANADKVYFDMGYSAGQVGKARAAGTVIEATGEEPEDTRDDVAGAGAPEVPPPGASPSKAGASKAGSAGRAGKSQVKK